MPSPLLRPPGTASTQHESTPPTGTSAACAVFVSRDPTDSFLANVAAVRDHVSEVLVVDNGSGPGSREVLERVAALRGVTTTCWTENRGIGAALNLAGQLARARGYGWMIAFDQDSTAPDGFVAALRSAVRTYEAPHLVAVVGPVYIDQGSGLITSFADGTRGEATRVDVTLTSGSLIRLDVLGELGGFDEGLFVDYVDIEYCLRCASRGYHVVESSRARLEHNLGHSVARRLLWKRFGVTNHSPLRRYYIARNRIILYRRYAASRPAWVLADMYSFARETVKILCYERDRGRKIGALLSGLLDGVRGVTGPRGG